MNLLENLLATGVLKTPEIIEALGAIDRAGFVRPEDKCFAYEDHPLSIGFGATISQPYTVAFMLEHLAPQAGDRVLDVGAGSGWTTALLAHIVGPRGRVWGVEIVPELAEFGQDNLKSYSKLPAKILRAGRELGLPSRAPFDKILVSAAAETVPAELLKQLAPGGRMVAPVGYSLWQIDKEKNGKIKTQEFPGFIFVPLTNV